MRSSTKVACVGEAIIDFVATRPGLSLSDTPGFRKHAGGAAANVAVGLTRLGTRVTFLGTVGQDSFGRFLDKELLKNKVDTRGLRFDPKNKTRLAFVSLMAAGERDFEFWEQHPADEQLRRRDLDTVILRSARIIHFSSFLLLKEPARSVILRVASDLKRNNRIVSFDPNLRLSLWRSQREARGIMTKMIRQTTVLRLNMDEAALLSGTRNAAGAAQKLRALGPVLVVITFGKNGCFFGTKGGNGYVPGFRVRAVDATGCGDGFLAGLLNGITKSGKHPGEMTVKEMEVICRRANAVGALTAQKHGVFQAIPDRKMLERFLAGRQTS